MHEGQRLRGAHAQGFCKNSGSHRRLRHFQARLGDKSAVGEHTVFTQSFPSSSACFGSKFEPRYLILVAGPLNFQSGAPVHLCGTRPGQGCCFAVDILLPAADGCLLECVNHEPDGFHVQSLTVSKAGGQQLLTPLARLQHPIIGLHFALQIEPVSSLSNISIPQHRVETSKPLRRCWKNISMHISVDLDVRRYTEADRLLTRIDSQMHSSLKRSSCSSAWSPSSWS